jgi:hypothetical protein
MAADALSRLGAREPLHDGRHLRGHLGSRRIGWLAGTSTRTIGRHRDPRSTSPSGPLAPALACTTRTPAAARLVLGADIPDLQPDHHRGPGGPGACPETSSSPWPMKEHGSGIVHRPEPELAVDRQVQYIAVETPAPVQVGRAQQDTAAENLRPANPRWPTGPNRLSRSCCLKDPSAARGASQAPACMYAAHSEGARKNMSRSLRSTPCSA